MSTVGVPLIRLEHIAKSYDLGEVTVHALRDISLTINEGEFVALMGPSGSGKSTLMNVLAFLDSPTQGSYQFSGTNIESFDEEYLADLRNTVIGFVFQQFHLLPRTTALDNVRLPMQYAGVKKAEQIERAQAAIEKVGLGSRMYHKPNELSGGQQQRVSIARALVNNPKVLFCDEPTGNLDSKTSVEVMNILSALHTEGKTIIMVTHEHDIAEFAQRTIHIKDGEII
ncbi:MAG: ABC transporter ATP-binding protein [Candidatus Kerfeldbacteria bacterium]|nr:ABC transporter ATP-binding protein [Candidatus Kerfeldbacteria bacterium]